jgi:hypothetical protein
MAEVEPNTRKESRIAIRPSNDTMKMLTAGDMTDHRPAIANPGSG